MFHFKAEDHMPCNSEKQLEFYLQIESDDGMVGRIKLLITACQTSSLTLD